MPNFQRGDMWSAYDKADYFVITTNSGINRAGELIMGKGVAGEARLRLPGIDKYLGRQLKNTKLGYLLDYHLVSCAEYPKVLGFQVKRNFRDKADILLIKSGVVLLTVLAVAQSDKQFHMNFPGIGWGSLGRADVLQTLWCLPHNVTIWEYEPILESKILEIVQ